MTPARAFSGQSKMSAGRTQTILRQHDTIRDQGHSTLGDLLFGDTCTVVSGLAYSRSFLAAERPPLFLVAFDGRYDRREHRQAADSYAELSPAAIRRRGYVLLDRRLAFLF